MSFKYHWWTSHKEYHPLKRNSIVGIPEKNASFEASDTANAEETTFRHVVEQFPHDLSGAALKPTYTAGGAEGWRFETSGITLFANLYPVKNRFDLSARKATDIGGFPLNPK
jgi:hypothetical protein